MPLNSWSSTHAQADLAARASHRRSDNCPGIRILAAYRTPFFLFSESKQDAAADLSKAQALLREGKPKEALKIIKQHRSLIENRDPQGKEWLNLLLESSAAVPDPVQLTFIYEFSPELFDNREKTALFVADQYIRTGQKDKYSISAAKVEGAENRPNMWFVLDADKMLAGGKQDRGDRILKTKNFDGKLDSGRLVRLGLLNVLADPQAAWKYFSEAVQKDPENADLRIYRAKLLEAAGKAPLALQEYGAALQLDPNSMTLRDLTAEFYLRNQQIPQAMQIWVETLPAPSSDIIWLKTLFWSKVLMPVRFDWSKHSPPSGPLEPLVSYLLSLKPAQFWD